MTGPIQGPWAITTPGVYHDMPDAHYHADPVPAGSVSNSGVKLLLKAPRKFQARQERPAPHKDHFDFGHAAHGVVLGTGQDIHVRQEPDARTKAGKLEIVEARARGAVPITKADWDTVHDMAAALAADPVAGRIFTPGRGVAERVIVGFDDDTGVWRRAKIDWTTHLSDGSLAYVDYKTAASADPDRLPRSMYDFGYYCQDPFYTDTGAMIGEEDVRFLFVLQEKDYPHLVTVAELEPEARAWGRVVVRKALSTYRQCVDTGVWPGYAADVVSVGLPRYADFDLERAWESGALKVVESA